MSDESVTPTTAAAADQPAPPKTQRTKKPTSAITDDGQLKMLFKSSTLKQQLNEHGFNMGGDVPALLNQFLEQTLKWYAKHPNNTFNTETPSISVELKGTLVDEYLRQYSLEPKRRTEVKMSARNVCAFVVHSATEICRDNMQKTVSGSNIETAAKISAHIIRTPARAAPPPPAAKDAEPQQQPKKKKKGGAKITSQAVMLDDDTAGAPVITGSDVPPAPKKTGSKRKHSDVNEARTEASE